MGGIYTKQAEYIGISTDTLRKYRNGDKECTAQTLLMLANYYEVSTDYLLGRIDYPAVSYDEALICKELKLSERSIGNIKNFITNESEENGQRPLLDKLLSDEDFISFIIGSKILARLFGLKSFIHNEWTVLITQMNNFEDQNHSSTPDQTRAITINYDFESELLTFHNYIYDFFCKKIYKLSFPIFFEYSNLGFDHLSSSFESIKKHIDIEINRTIVSSYGPFTDNWNTSIKKEYAYNEERKYREILLDYINKYLETHNTDSAKIIVNGIKDEFEKIKY